jgi:hypothetical protein
MSRDGTGSVVSDVCCLIPSTASVKLIYGDDITDTMGTVLPGEIFTEISGTMNENTITNNKQMRFV